MSGPDRERMAEDEWVQRALQARIDQFGTIAIEDEATLDFLADILRRPGAE